MDYQKRRKVKRFLEKFEPEISDLTLLYADPSNRMHTEDDIDSLYELNEHQQRDIYFIPNYGGTRINEIEAFNTCFLDLDAGKDTNGQYFSDRKIRRKKKTIFKAIINFEITPNIVVDTRNGYHVYWLLVPTWIDGTRTIPNVWNTIQKRLCQHFAPHGSDKKVLKANQILRLPYSWWHKKDIYHRSKGIKEYYCDPTYFRSKRYTLSDLDRLTSKLSNNEKSRKYHNNWSFDSWSSNKPKTTKKYHNSESLPEKGDTYGLIRDTTTFLRDVNQVLFRNNMQYMAKEANVLIEKLNHEFNI